jgi:hypothetical protein
MTAVECDTCKTVATVTTDKYYFVDSTPSGIWDRDIVVSRVLCQNCSELYVAKSGLGEVHIISRIKYPLLGVRKV